MFRLSRHHGISVKRCTAILVASAMFFSIHVQPIVAAIVVEHDVPPPLKVDLFNNDGTLQAHFDLTEKVSESILVGYASIRSMPDRNAKLAEAKSRILSATANKPRQVPGRTAGRLTLQVLDALMAPTHSEFLTRVAQLPVKVEKNHITDATGQRWLASTYSVRGVKKLVLRQHEAAASKEFFGTSQLLERESAAETERQAHSATLAPVVNTNPECWENEELCVGDATPADLETAYVLAVAMDEDGAAMEEEVEDFEEDLEYFCAGNPTHPGCPPQRVAIGNFSGTHFSLANGAEGDQSIVGHGSATLVDSLSAGAGSCSNETLQEKKSWFGIAGIGFVASLAGVFAVAATGGMAIVVVAAVLGAAAGTGALIYTGIDYENCIMSIAYTEPN